ncbi:hypothetical protein [Arthrobacter alpinus]|nr:hypothetical protein [Arthrobacter alpinus]
MPSTNVSTSDPADLDKPAMVRAKQFGWLLVITGAIAWIASSPS